MRNTPIFSAGFSEEPACRRISCDCNATRSTFCERKCISLGRGGGSPTIQSVWPGCSGCVTCHIPGPAYSPVTTTSSIGASAAVAVMAPISSSEVVRASRMSLVLQRQAERLDGLEHLLLVGLDQPVCGVGHFQHLSVGDAAPE